MKLSARYLAGAILALSASTYAFAQATSDAPSSQTKSTVEETRTDPSTGTSTTRTTTTTTTVSGKVATYTPGKSVTVLKADGSQETYIINPQSTVPEKIAVGGSVTIMPVDSGEKVVRSITIQ